MSSAKFDRYTTAEIVADTFADVIKGKNVIITGASLGGLGAESARVISKYANLVVLAGRSLERLQATADSLKKEGATSQFRLLKIDLASLKSVRAAAAEVNAYSEPIHVLLNNAASYLSATYQVTEDGFESQFGGGHLGPFLFTNLILPRLQAGAATGFARVVFVSSGANLQSSIRWEDPNFKAQKGADYSSSIAYAQTKTANVLSAVEFTRRWKEHGIAAYSLHPGVYDSALHKSQPQEDSLAMGIKDKDGNKIGDLWRTLGECTATQVLASFDPALTDKPGSYLADCQVFTSGWVAPHALDPENAKKLWTISEELVGQKF